MQLDPKRHAWMNAPELRVVMDALGGQARIVGGAVRNGLLGRDVDDVDLATPLVPDEVSKRLAAAGINAVPTGIEHGTVTAVANGKPYEVTTLRRDVETDGRRAVVAFTTDWAEDAQRRDFTINALYADLDGNIHDTVGGVEDLKAGRVRFVGDATARIREDYLRILRLFRFHAWYGRGEIDSAALHAAAAEKAGLAKLSGERVQKEVLKLLAAKDPAPVLRIMAASGILTELLPGDLDIARLERLAAIDASAFFTPDPVLRLAALLPNDVTVARDVAKRWRLSGADALRLEDLAGSREKIVSYLSVKEMRKLLYRLGIPRLKDRIFLKWAADPKESNAIQWRMMLAVSDAWERPKFPLSGREVMLAGVPEGPMVGRILEEVEDW
ncbi:MAG TPA: CCA tRNA nucleotidyltransferase, partial [Rhizomicrobium sp.]|nr:CCA tRNA nucleotidyltransferase [Rhizomicrobium sp.]